ncbi:MAG: hypothetical protein QXQ40_01250 [Candidatus Aenigmatarchaeota archaeon]
MLDNKTIKKINDFVYVKPRTINEIAELISTSWKTADRYVDKIIKEEGNIATRIFREGTRGAIKIVYWNNIERIHSSDFQEKLLKKIETSKIMSPFDIYQYVDEKKRNATIIDAEKCGIEDKLKDYLRKSKEQVLSFSGNLSWINAKEGNEKIIDVIEELGKNGVSIKILSRITVDSIKNVRNALLINEKLGKSIIEIRHCEQPLRGFIIDNQVVRFREMLNPLDYRKGELDNKILLFYEIFDSEWIEWCKNVFFYFFRASIPAEKRIRDLDSIKNIYKYL